MICEVCGAKIPEGKAECPQCGYPVIVSLGNSPQEKAQREAAAEQYRAQLCQSIEVGFYAYSHKIVKQNDGSEKLGLDRTDKVSLGTCGSMQNGQTFWYPEGFLRPQSGHLECRIYIRRPDRSEGTRDLSIPIPKGSADVHIGLKKISTSIVKICLTDGQAYTGESEELSVL